MAYEEISRFYAADTFNSVAFWNRIKENFDADCNGLATGMVKDNHYIFVATGNQALQKLTGTLGKTELLRGDGTFGTITRDDITIGQHPITQTIENTGDMVAGEAHQSHNILPIGERAGDAVQVDADTTEPIWGIFPATYASLNANGGVGTGSNQAAQGNHDHY